MPAEEASGDRLDRGAGTAAAAATLPKKMGLGGLDGGVAAPGRIDLPGTAQRRSTGDYRIGDFNRGCDTMLQMR